MQRQVDIPISKAISEEGGEPRPCPAVDTDDESELDSIAFGYVDKVVLHPQGQHQPNQVLLLEVVFRAAFVYLPGPRGSKPSVPTADISRLPSHAGDDHVVRNSTYIVDFAPLLFVGLGPGDSSKAGEEPFGHGVDRIDSGYIGDLGAAGGDVEAQEVLHGHQVRSDHANV